MAVVRVQVVTRGRDTLIKLFRTDNGKLVAQAPVRPEGPAAVEQVIDSSRYFALRVESAAGAWLRGSMGCCRRARCEAAPIKLSASPPPLPAPRFSNAPPPPPSPWGNCRRHRYRRPGP
jgi:hypothetical protein